MSAYDKLLGDLTAFLGVGALHILGFFLILDGNFNVYFFLEDYMQSSTWIFFVVIPLLVVAYVLGVLSKILSNLVVSKIFGRNDERNKLFARVAIVENEMLSNRYIEM